MVFKLQTIKPAKHISQEVAGVGFHVYGRVLIYTVRT